MDSTNLHDGGYLLTLAASIAAFVLYMVIMQATYMSYHYAMSSKAFMQQLATKLDLAVVIITFIIAQD